MFARLAITATAALAAMLAFAGTALADPPVGDPPGGPCENGPPPWWCDGGKVRDGITVTTEPAGANCPAGGLRVTIDRERKRPNEFPPGALPESEDQGRVKPEDSDGRPPRPEPEPRVLFVCNGIDGAPGPAGPIGPPGVAGPQGPAGPTITVPVQPKVCQSSTRIGVRLYLPPRLARFGVVRLQIAKVNGLLRFDANVRTRVNRTGPPGQPFVFVPLRARACGSYLLTVGRGAVQPVVQVWQITGRFGLKRTTITG